MMPYAKTEFMFLLITMYEMKMFNLKQLLKRAKFFAQSTILINCHHPCSFLVTIITNLSIRPAKSLQELWGTLEEKKISYVVL